MCVRVCMCGISVSSCIFVLAQVQFTYLYVASPYAGMDEDAGTRDIVRHLLGIIFVAVRELSVNNVPS